MRRLLPALLLIGCLQGGHEELEGTWYAPKALDVCRQVVTFGPGEAYRVECSDTGEAYAGTYAVDGEVIHIVGDVSFDMQWAFGDVPDTLLLRRDEKAMVLHRRKP